MACLWGYWDLEIKKPPSRMNDSRGNNQTNIRSIFIIQKLNTDASYFYNFFEKFFSLLMHG